VTVEKSCYYTSRACDKIEKFPKHWASLQTLCFWIYKSPENFARSTLPVVTGYLKFASALKVSTGDALWRSCTLAGRNNQVNRERLMESISSSKPSFYSPNFKSVTLKSPSRHGIESLHQFRSSLASLSFVELPLQPRLALGSVSGPNLSLSSPHELRVTQTTRNISMALLSW
jgi:hypothetical protein